MRASRLLNKTYTSLYLLLSSYIKFLQKLQRQKIVPTTTKIQKALFYVCIFIFTLFLYPHFNKKIDVEK